MLLSTIGTAWFTVALKTLVRHFLSLVYCHCYTNSFISAELFIKKMTTVKLFGVYIVCLYVSLTLIGNLLEAMIQLSFTERYCTGFVICHLIFKSHVNPKLLSERNNFLVQTSVYKWVHIPSQRHNLLSECWWNRPVAICIIHIQYVQEVRKLRQVLEIRHAFIWDV